MDGDPTYEADFVLATLVDHDSSIQSSQASVTAAASIQQPSTSKGSKDKKVNRWEGSKLNDSFAQYCICKVTENELPVFDTEILQNLQELTWSLSISAVYQLFW